MQQVQSHTLGSRPSSHKSSISSPYWLFLTVGTHSRSTYLQPQYSYNTIYVWSAYLNYNSRNCNESCNCNYLCCSQTVKLILWKCHCTSQVCNSNGWSNLIPAAYWLYFLIFTLQIICDCLCLSQFLLKKCLLLCNTVMGWNNYNPCFEKEVTLLLSHFRCVTFRLIGQGIRWSIAQVRDTESSKAEM